MSTTPVLHQSTVPQALSEEWWENNDRTANRLANISWIPEVYRRKPAEIAAAGVALAVIGKDLTPMTLKLVYVVNGTVDFMVDLITAQVHAHGHEMWVEESDETHATVAGQRRGSNRVHRVTFTIEQARDAGLVGKDVWKRYVNDMLVARAAKRCAKRVCPEALLSMPPPLHYVQTDSGRIQLAEIGYDPDDQDDDVVDAELVEQGEDPGPIGAAAPQVHTKTDPTIDPEKWAAFVRWSEAGEPRDENGFPVDVPEVVATIEPGEQGDNVDADRGASAAPPVPGPIPRLATGGIDWREVATRHGVTVGKLHLKAREFATSRGVEPPAEMKDLTDEQVEADVIDWLVAP